MSAASNEAPAGRILVVDDDDDSRRLLTHLLKRRNYHVIAAEGGRAALKLLEKASVDVILLDVMMPEMDGFAVCEALRKDPATAAIPIILVTARDDLYTRAAGMKLGVSEFLTKPVNRDELFSRLQTQIAANRRSEALDKVGKRSENPY